MNIKADRIKKPKDNSLLSDRVKIFSKSVEKLSGKKREPAEYMIVDIPRAEPSTFRKSKQQCASLSMQDRY